jgi:hypothetical protein
MNIEEQVGKLFRCWAWSNDGHAAADRSFASSDWND